MATSLARCAAPRAAPFLSSTSSRRGAPAAAPALRRRQPCRPAAAVPVEVAQLAATASEVFRLAALDIDWSDPDTQIGALGAILGLGLGIAAPAFYATRDARDEERLEELRALNRATKAETGEYLNPDEIAAIRPPRWTDRREFQDDD